MIKVLRTFTSCKANRMRTMVPALMGFINFHNTRYRT
ncbi:hypothetical protein TSMEX_006213 [Taenia solium]|eukprot:TsM_000758400 transcript=TsM_000758400 gene=TsM_000758400